MSLAGAKTVIGKKMRKVENLGVPDLESVNDRIYTTGGLENAVLPVGYPIKFKVHQKLGS